jgi:hypothetical protein
MLFRGSISLLVLMIFASVAFGADPTAKVLKKGATDGTFVRIEQADYAHLYIKNKANTEESFFILKPDASLRPYLADGKKLVGSKLRVRWEERMQNLPEAGGPTRIQIVTKVEHRN